MLQSLRTAISLLVGALVVSTTVLAQPASAAPADQAGLVAAARAPKPGGSRPVVVSDTGWVPARTGLEAGGACGGIVAGYPKDQNSGTREQQTVTYRNGDVVTRLRGSVTLSLHMEDDGWPGNPVFPPPQDFVVSGAVTRVDYASGAVLLKRVAPGILAVHTSTNAPGPEQVAFTEAKLPSVYLLKRGTFTEYLGPDRHVKIVRTSTRLANVCDSIGFAQYRDSTVLVYDTDGIGAPIYPVG
jgi:hypothetical protein